MSDLTKLNLEGHVKAAKAKKNPKSKKVATDDGGRGIPAPVEAAPAIETANPVEVAEPVTVEVAKKPPVPKKKREASPAPVEPEKVEAPAVPAPVSAPVATAEKVKPLGKSAVATLAALSQKGKLTRAQIAEAIGVGSGFTSLLGSLDDSKVEAGSLRARGLIVPEAVEGGKSVVWAITEAGKDALKAATAKK